MRARPAVPRRREGWTCWWVGGTVGPASGIFLSTFFLASTFVRLGTRETILLANNSLKNTESMPSSVAEGENQVGDGRGRIDGKNREW